MTPEFAEAIDPIFLHVLGLLDRIGHGEEPFGRDEELRISGWLDRAEGRLGRSEDWELAKYAIVSWIDEVMIDAPWEGSRWWNENKLETEIYNTNDREWKFYAQAKEAFKLQKRDALEVYYVCMVLGFRGLYRDPVKAAHDAEVLQLPPDLETWAREVSMAIRLGQGRPQISDGTRPIEGAAPLEGPSMLIWSAFTGVVLVVFVVMVVWLGIL
jgi:type VI secretion system protein ImpK